MDGYDSHVLRIPFCINTVMNKKVGDMASEQLHANLYSKAIVLRLNYLSFQIQNLTDKIL